MSVVLAAYNEEKLVGRCLDAILAQDYPKDLYDVIVVNNNSTDKTAQIVKEKGLKPYFYDKHQGAIWAKQYGVSQAKGEIVVVTDADTVVQKGWLEHVSRLMKNPKLQCVGGTVLALEGNLFSRVLLVAFDYFSLAIRFVGVPFIWGCNIAFRKSAFEAVGGFNTSLKTSDDWEFVVRIQKKYGLKSVLYSSKVRVKTSTRKQESISALIPYVSVGILNFITLFVLRTSKTFWSNPNVR